MALKFTYKIKEFIINKNTVKDFVFMINRRKQRQSAINRLKRALSEGNHFDSPIVVNKFNSKYRIIDGNHRITAIKEFLEDNPREKVVVLLAIYEGLDKDEENDIFTRWNVGTRQTKDDFIMNRQDDIPILKWLDEDFPWPVSIYKNRDQLHFYRLVSAYLATREGKPGYQNSNEAFVRDAINLSKEDFEFLRKFVASFRAYFGDPRRDNVYANTTPIIALMNLYYSNKDKLAESKIWRLLTKMKANNQANSLCVMGGRTAASTLIRLLESITGLRSNIPVTEIIKHVEDND